MEISDQQPAIIDALRKKIAKGGVIFFIGYTFGAVITILLHLSLSRKLGAADYGLYALGYAIFFIIRYFCMFGLNWGIVKFVSVYKAEENLRKIAQTVASAFLISTMLCIAMTAIVFTKADIIASGLFAKPQLAYLLKGFFLVLVFYNINILSSFVFQAYKDMKYHVILRYVLPPLLNLLIVHLFFMFGFKIEGVIYSFMISVVFAAIVSLYLLNGICPLKEIFKKPIYETGRLLRFSLPLLFIGFSYILLNQISKLFIGRLYTSFDVGIYNIAVNVVMPVVLARSCIDAIFSPIISDLYNKNRIGEIGFLLKTSTRWIFSFGLLISILYILFSRNIMYLFGSDFVAGWKVLVVLSFAYFVNTAVGSVPYILVMSGKQNVELINSVCIFCYNILMNIWLIKLYGILGAAIATGSSIILLNLIRLAEVKIFFNIHPYDRKYIKPIFAGLAISLVYLLFFKGINFSGLLWCLPCAFLVLTYIAIMIGLRLETEDALILNTVKQRLFQGRMRTLIDE